LADVIAAIQAMATYKFYKLDVPMPAALFERFAALLAA
jgi:hypothetical protein